MLKGRPSEESLREKLFTRVTLEVTVPGEAPEEVVGLLKDVVADKILVSIRGQDRVIPIEYISEKVDRVFPRLPLEKREVRTAPTHLVRQHLLDRHGYPYALLDAMADEQAAAVHEGLDHHLLGHSHKDRATSYKSRRIDAG